jgi:hypothetical protein
MNWRNEYNEEIHLDSRCRSGVVVDSRIGVLIPDWNWAHARATLSNMLVAVSALKSFRNCMIWPSPCMV